VVKSAGHDVVAQTGVRDNGEYVVALVVVALVVVVLVRGEHDREAARAPVGTGEEYASGVRRPST
jgi:hypothetical protein